MPPARVVHFQRAPGQGRNPPGYAQQIRDSPDRPEGDTGIDWQFGCDPSGHILVDREIDQQEGEQPCQDGESFAYLAIHQEISFGRFFHTIYYKL